jgi:hypothetical protein
MGGMISALMLAIFLNFKRTISKEFAELVRVSIQTTFRGRTSGATLQAKHKICSIETRVAFRISQSTKTTKGKQPELSAHNLDRRK